MERGKFIVFEGIDGSGKSTALKEASSALAKADIAFVAEREPTGGRIGNLISSFMSGREGYNFDERTVAALFAADRLDHLLRAGGILDTLSKGVNVLCDRFWLSSLAYQSSAYGMDRVWQLNEGICSLIKPDLTLYYAVPADTALQRIDSRGEKTEYYERRDRLERTLRCYGEAIEKRRDEDNIITIDGSRPENVVAGETVGHILQLIIA